MLKRPLMSKIAFNIVLMFPLALSGSGCLTNPEKEGGKAQEGYYASEQYFERLLMARASQKSSILLRQ